MRKALTPAGDGAKMKLLLGRGRISARFVFVLSYDGSAHSGAHKDDGRFSPEADARILCAPLCVSATNEKARRVSVWPPATLRTS